MQAAKTTHGLSEGAIRRLVGVYFWLSEVGSKSSGNYILIKGSYLLGCRVSEIAAIKWGDIESLDGGGQVHLLGKGGKARTVRISGDTLALFERLGRGENRSFVFPSPRTRGHLTRQAIGDVCRKRGGRASFHVNPHQLRHSHATHAVQRGVDVFTLQATL